MEIIGNVERNKVVGSPEGLRVHFYSVDCSIEVGDECQLSGLTVHFRSPGCKVVIGPRCIMRGDVHLKSPNVSVLIGRNLRARTGIFMNVAGGNVVIGDDCLFASVKFRTSDSHRILDAASGEAINPPGNIVVGDRVWMAEDVLLLRNAEVGSDSVVGARSLVNGSIPDGSLAVGTPARVVRTGVRWEE
ncbi:acyltransferase [Roseomonas elaeocarpi]|uniref:Acyltransferase n=1 Tax=Roseomonas elaeocarpi TaxID=907779 RepID=A0ABV6JLL9_9PROT